LFVNGILLDLRYTALSQSTSDLRVFGWREDVNDELNKNTPPNPQAQVDNGAAANTEAEQDAMPATVEELQAELESLRAKAAEYMDGWQRARAEFVNYRKRVEREREDTFQHATIAVLKKLLPVVDDFDRAMSNVPAELQKNTWVHGIQMVGQKCHTLLDSHQLREVDPVGEAFDPSLHEAIGTDDTTEIESGHITAVLQKGYVYGEQVVRPALVRVAK
jgi:molecular chaperone GrpE